MERADTHTAFAKQIVEYRDAEGPEQLDHRAKQVEQMMAMPGWGFVCDLLRAREDSITARLYPRGADDGILSGEQVHRALGLAAALRQARELPYTILVKAEETRKARESEAREPAGAGA